MNLLGKSLTFVIFILSLVFMVIGIAVNASHRNWRDVVLGPNGLKEQITTIETTNNQLRDEKNRIESQLAREQFARRTALAALQSQQDLLQKELIESEAANGELRAQNTELAQLDRARATDLEAKTAQVNRLREELKGEQENRMALFQEVLDTTDNMNLLRGTLQNMSQRNEQLLSENTRNKEVLDAHGINANDPIDGTPPERNGNILAVNRVGKRVEISIGSDDGIREGHQLDVTRNGSYVTRILVRFIQPDRAVAEILEPYTSLTVQEGDRVDTLE